MSNELGVIQSMKALKLLKEYSKHQISNNLFNPNEILDGQQLNGNSLVSAPNYFTSGFIPIETNVQYLISNARNIIFNDSNKNFINGSTMNLNGQKANVVLSTHEFSNAKYIRFSALKTTLPNTYIYKIPLQSISKFLGKLTVVLGDSLTAQNMWQPYLRRKMGMFINNYGVGGTQVTDDSGNVTNAMCRDERITAMLSFCDYCIFLGGTNDWGHHIPLGSISDTGTNTFYGALKTVARKLTNKYPTSKIIFAAPPCSLKPGATGWSDVTGEKNNLGLTIADYGTAIGKVAQLYGFPFVDLYGNCGWNPINVSSFMQNEPNTLVHPNDLGAERMAIELERRLNSLAPLA